MPAKVRIYSDAVTVDGFRISGVMNCDVVAPSPIPPDGRPWPVLTLRIKCDSIELVSESIQQPNTPDLADLDFDPRGWKTGGMIGGPAPTPG